MRHFLKTFILSAITLVAVNAAQAFTFHADASKVALQPGVSCDFYIQGNLIDANGKIISNSYISILNSGQGTFNSDYSQRNAQYFKPVTKAPSGNTYIDCSFKSNPNVAGISAPIANLCLNTQISNGKTLHLSGKINFDEKGGIQTFNVNCSVN